MRLPGFLTRWLARRLIEGVADQRVRSVNIGPGYMLRWWLRGYRHLRDPQARAKVRAAQWFDAYLHCFLRSDDDRALHDHVSASVSILLRGHYIEHLPKDPRHPAGPTVAHLRRAGQIVIRTSGAQPHRVELTNSLTTGEPEPCWSLFIIGPRVREWGFWCPKGWKHHAEFTGDPGHGGQYLNTPGGGPGCDD